MIEIKVPHDGPGSRTIQLDGSHFTEFCSRIHLFNMQWWLDPKTHKLKDRNVGEMLMLMTSELAEALEAHRKDKMDDHLPQYHGVDVELVDCIIRCFDLLGARYIERMESAREHEDAGKLAPSYYSPGDVFEAKCKFNSERADHKPENRVKPGGKAY